MCSTHVCVLLVLEPSVSHMRCKCSLYYWSEHPHPFKEVFIFMYVVALSTCVPVHHVYGEVLEPLELQLQRVVGCLWVLGTKPWLS